MRKSLLLALLVGAATPALAAGDPGDRHNDRQAERAERQQARQEARSEAKAERAERADHAASVSGQDRPHFTPRSSGGGASEMQQDVELRRQNVERRQMVERSRVVEHEAPQQVEIERRVRNVEPTETSRRQERQQSIRDRIVRENVAQDIAASPLRQHDRSVPAVLHTRTPVVSATPREGTQPPLRTERRSRDHVTWSTTKWRNDHRYDWRNHRHHHRSLFHLGLYYDPFGWGYRPYSIGWRLWPSYYSSRYWINDPWMYRLPYAPAGYRWVRYWDDALLVDTWTGEVVDVIRNFFW